MIVSIEVLATNAGGLYLQFAKIANVTILGVKREGLNYTEVSGSPSGRQFKYTEAAGRIDFAIPFLPPVLIGSKKQFEIVWILIKT